MGLNVSAESGSPATATEIHTMDGPIVIERHADGIAVVRMPRMVDVYTAPAIREASLGLVRAGAYRIVVDLGPTELIDSMGLGVLLGMLKRARGHAGAVVVAGMDERVAKTFRVTGLKKYFERFGTVDEALAALRDADAAAAAVGAAGATEDAGEPVDIGTLRRAAREIADDCKTAPRRVRPFLLAVATWLDESAYALQDAGNRIAGCDEPGAIESALKIARAYPGKPES